MSAWNSGFEAQVAGSSFWRCSECIGGRISAMTTPAIGIAAALGSAGSWALGAILFKRIGESMSPLAMTLVKSAVSVVFLGIALLFLGFSNVTPQNLWLMIASGLVGIAIGDTLFFAA